jgi:tetratricopeptide (TPR) repeat protein
MNKQLEEPKHPNRLRILVKQAHYRMREIHQETGIPESTLYAWAAGKYIIPAEERIMLAQLLRCSVSDLAPLYSTTAMVQLPLECSCIELERDMDKKRRELLQLLGLASSALLMSSSAIDWDRVAILASGRMPLDEQALQNLETINHHLWNLFIGTSTKSSVLDGVLGQLKMHLQFLKEPQTSRTQQGLYKLASDLSQLAGEIFFDLLDYDMAQSCYLFAASAAKEANAYDLWATACVRHAYLPIYEGRYENALPLLENAWRIAQQGNSLFPTKYWVAAVQAEAEAGIGNLTGCQKALDQASGVLDLTNVNPAWIRFDGSRLPALKGACYVQLQCPDLAVSSLLEALQQPLSLRRRGMIFTDLSLVALQREEVEAACSYGEELVNLAANGSSGFLRKHVQKLQRHLAPFATLPSVKSLEQQIVSVV